MTTNTASAYTIVETLQAGSGTRLLRAFRNSDHQPVILKVIDSKRGRPQDLERLKHELEIGKTLDVRSVISPLALGTYEGLPVLILEDFGGEPLDHLLGSPMDTGRFLALALRITAAVADVHRRSVVHKNLKPQNILVRASTGEVKLTDFSIASRLPREHTSPRSPRHIEGSLPYMSPEQTGRTNRAIDSRSDLYSLGVTYYQMLTGRLPFDARDPLEWVHSHIARLPPSPSEVVPGVPETLSRIVMKLLAKTADERYQSAHGLAHDLERCLAQWREHGALEPFPLGERDVSGLLRIPQKLYGREAELAHLRDALGRVVTRGTPELVLVGGNSGIGKSSLVRELHETVVRAGGKFLSGKFEPYARNVPYATVAQAFKALVLDLLAEDEERLRATKQALWEALGSNGKLILDLLPPLEHLLGRLPPVPELPPTEAERRFRGVFRKFLGVFATREHPLVLFLDDLQWVDSSSLGLIEDLLVAPGTRHLLLIGTWRDNEVSASHPLTMALERIRKTSARVSGLVLEPLRLEHVVQLVADTVRAVDREHVRPLATLVYEKTAGTPFFILQFLTTLYEERLLEFDESSATWRWDIERIRQKGYTDNVVDFLLGKLVGLPATVQDVLETAACIGSKGKIALLALAGGRSEEETRQDLCGAIREGLVLSSRDAYAFAHDRVQLAAYSLLSEGHRDELHLRIGRLLMARTPPDELEERLFDVVTQLDLGAAMVTEPGERTRIAELNLRAARKAKASAAYRIATSYLATGMEMLDRDSWEHQYRLTYESFLERAHCEFLSGNSDEAGRLFPVLLRHARTRVDKAAVICIQINTHLTRGELRECIETALAGLRMFGIEMSPNPSASEVEQVYRSVWNHLGNRPIEELLAQPPMTDPDVQAAMNILTNLRVPAFSSDLHLLSLSLCHAMLLSLRHGNAATSPPNYAWFGMVLCHAYHRYEEGYRFARLALELSGRSELIAYKAKMYSCLGVVSFWSRPIDTGLEFLRTAIRVGEEDGDVLASCYAWHHIVSQMFVRGDTLADVHRESGRGLDFIQRARFQDALDTTLIVDRLVQALRGETRHLSSFDDERFSEAELESRLLGGQNKTVMCLYHLMRLAALFMAGDYAEALAAGRRGKALLGSCLALVHVYLFHFHDALALAAVYSELPSEQRREALDDLSAHHEQLREWAELYPPTFQSAHLLVSAELARLSGRGEEAMRLYEESIRSARTNGLVQHEGLAYEFASRFYRTRGLELIADTYLREARACYVRWGAEGKVKWLDQRHPHLVERQPLEPLVTISARTEQLDLLSVFKASQSISGEIILDKLLRKLLEVVLEQGGAQKGCLLLSRGGALSIEAEATLVEGRGVVTQVLQSQPLSSSTLVPVSIVHYVVRTKERVILDDAATAVKYASDAYMAHARPRSLLCLPILRQAEVVGLLYLENDLVPGAFTPERLAALELLASQAAISLENALLLSREQSARSMAELAERRSRFLAEAGELLSESLQYEATLTRLSRLCVRSMADWCVIDLVEDGALRRLAGAHADPAKETLLRKLQLRHPPTQGSAHGATRVQRSHQPLVLPELSDDIIRRMTDDEEHRQLIHALGSRSALVVPIMTRGELLGAISLVSGEPGFRYGSAELELAQEVARRAATAIDNARLYRKTQEAIRVRDEFLSVASHEFNTPLTSLTLSLQALLRSIQVGRRVEPQELKRQLERALLQGARLGRLNRALLDVSLLHSGRLPLELMDVELGAVVRETLEHFAPELARARCPISVQEDARAVGSWDRTRLGQVVANLLSNAIKFGAGRPIELHIGMRDGRARLSVTDHGIGIEPSQRARIFGRFERAVSERHYGGLGLGLYISRGIAEAHGGTLQVESQPGEGATFTVELPCAGPTAQEGRVNR
ncbi:sensor histidine kinase [Archangium violaceum]|uniref:sensor histidine kinase n=1 Tax=Archangium violaceum TaxID=83451 RepID=UPI001EF4F542|nr:AAA family ATPase [Archangium violaceum]